MSEENVEEIDDTVPAEEEGLFFVSQISPIEAEEEVKPEAKEPAEGGEDETAEDIEDETYTYQVAPTISVNPLRIREVAQRILEDRLKDKEYNASFMKKAASQISCMVREEVKRLSLDRYRIIAQVTIGEKCDQDVLMNFLYLWKPDVDHYAIAKFENRNFFATVLVFLVYKQ